MLRNLAAASGSPTMTWLYLRREPAKTWVLMLESPSTVPQRSRHTYLCQGQPTTGVLGITHRSRYQAQAAGFRQQSRTVGASTPEDLEIQGKS